MNVFTKNDMFEVNFSHRPKTAILGVGPNCALFCQLLWVRGVNLAPLQRLEKLSELQKRSTKQCYGTTFLSHYFAGLLFSSTVFPPPSTTQPTNLILYKETEIGEERKLHSSEKQQKHQMHQKYWTTSTHIHVHEDTCQKFGKHFSFDSAVRSERVNLLWEKSQKLKMEAKSHPKLIGMPSIYPERFNSSCVLQSHH